MKREIDLREISDGKLYSANDMVKADCHDCQGCSACCHGMGESILLDPRDLWRLMRATGLSFEEMLDQYVELHLVDGMILPNLKMNEETDACSFLDGEGRCSIHAHRPGICRLFPLGRVFEDGKFQYFLQIYECEKKDRSKIKVKKWISEENFPGYEKYINDWHGFVLRCTEAIKTLEESQRRTLTLYVLRAFFQTPYQSDDFYEEFYRRFTEAKELFGF